MFKSRKESELFEKELELYKKERYNELNNELESYRRKTQESIYALAKQCYEDMSAHEHDYHYGMECKGIEIAKLEAKLEGLNQLINAKKEVAEADNNLFDSMNSEIFRLNDIIASLIEVISAKKL